MWVPVNVESLIKAPNGSTSTFFIALTGWSVLELFFVLKSKFNSLVVEETFSSMCSMDLGETPLELTTSGWVELSGEFRWSHSNSLLALLILGLEVVLLASPFSTAAALANILLALVVVVHRDLVEAVVVVRVEFRRKPDWAWCEVVEDVLKVGVTVAEGLVLTWKNLID